MMNMTADIAGPATVRTLQFKRTLSGVWAAYPVPDYALTIRCRASGWIFRGTAHPDFVTAVAAANTWWSDQLRGQIITTTPKRSAA